MDDLKRILLESLALKELPRTGWLRAGIANPESVASHSWGVAWLSLVLCPANLDRGRVLEMATIHDLAEVRVGDITPHDSVSREDKHRMEDEAMNDLLEVMCHRNELKALWDECEAGVSKEARFVRAMDKLDMALQAQRYGGLEEFIDSALESLDDDLHRELAELSE
ncbi:MAG: HD domain-containing protein [Candidatus Poseidoniaceae archaeon]|nr:HD domain-containing protein [Candidatus Poseidoniaceae archaeon]